MLVLRRGLQLASQRRPFHSNCLYLGPAEDPGYFGLFPPQQQENQPPQQQAELAHDQQDQDHVKQEQLRIAFCDKIREWARTTPPEYISRPPLRSRSRSRSRSRRHSKPVATHERKGIGKEDEHDDNDDDEDEDDEDEDDDDDEEDGSGSDDELDVVDDEDALDALDAEDENNVDREDGVVRHGRKYADRFHDEDTDDERENVCQKSGGVLHLDKDPVDDDEKARQKLLPCDPQNDGRGDADEELYYYTERGKLKYKPIHIIAPKEEIYQRLSESGLISSRLKRPMPVLKLVKRTDAEIVGWYYYCSIELLQFFRICHNLKEVKAIVEYHIRWSAIRTLAKKYRCNAREIVKKYGRDLECEDKKGKKVRLMSRQEIKDVSRGVNKRVQMIHRFRALNILDEMD